MRIWDAEINIIWNFFMFFIFELHYGRLFLHTAVAEIVMSPPYIWRFKYYRAEVMKQSYFNFPIFETCQRKSDFTVLFFVNIFLKLLLILFLVRKLNLYKYHCIFIPKCYLKELSLNLLNFGNGIQVYIWENQIFFKERKEMDLSFTEVGLEVSQGLQFNLRGYLFYL